MCGQAVVKVLTA